MAKVDASFLSVQKTLQIKFENVLDGGLWRWSSHVKSFYPDASYINEYNKLHNERLSLGKVHNVYLSDEVTEKDFMFVSPFQQTGNGFYKKNLRSF